MNKKSKTIASLISNLIPNLLKLNSNLKSNTCNSLMLLLKSNLTPISNQIHSSTLTSNKDHIAQSFLIRKERQTDH